ncbi:MAG: addiction module protein [Pseudomonadota bacterium]
MNEKIKLLCDQARLLSPKERAELVEDILSTLEMPDSVITRTWIKEADDRLKAYRSGKIKARDISDILTKYSVS